MDRQTALDRIEDLLPIAAQWATEQERRVLSALALYDPGVRATSLRAEPTGSGPRLEGRDVRFDLGE